MKLSFLNAIVFFALTLPGGAVENVTHENVLNTEVPSTTLMPKINEVDKVFVMTAYKALEHQKRLAEIALQKSPSAETKQMVDTLKEEYSKSSKALIFLAGTKDVALTEDATLDQRSMEEDLAKLFGDEFFAAYLEDISRLHTELVGIFEKAAISAKDQDVKAFAEANLPVTRRHLQIIKTIFQKVKESDMEKITEL